MNKLSIWLDDAVDFTDSNASADIAHAALKMMPIVARALRDDSRGFRMGRDNAMEMSVALTALAEEMRLVPRQDTKAMAELFDELLGKYSGLDDIKE